MKKKENTEVVFSNITKRSLREFNEAEARGWTIDRLMQIEYRIDEKILAYFKPANKEVFKEIVLNSAILDIGSKLKILLNTGLVEKQIIEKIRKLAAIRNGFAHAPVVEHIAIVIDEKDKSKSHLAAASSVIKVMNSQGEIKEKNAYEYLMEFLELQNEIRDKI